MTNRILPSCALFEALLALLAATGCSPTPTMAPAEAAYWLNAYPAERIADHSAIVLEPSPATLLSPKFSRDSLSADIFAFSPKMKGALDVAYSGGLSLAIAFKPAPGELKAGKTYRCTVDMQRLTGVDTLPDFAFEFTVVPIEMALRDMSATIDPADPGKARVEGTLLFSDEPAAELLRQLAVSSCKGAKVSIAAAAEPTARRIVVTDIARRRDDYTLTVEVGAPGMEAAADKVVIPGTTSLTLLSATRHDAAQPWLELNFSAPLAADQELDGLIAIDGIDELRLERDGATVRAYYPPNLLGELRLRLSQLIRDSSGSTLCADMAMTIRQEVIPPEVKITATGTIVPDERCVKLPFRAVGLAAVDVEVIKVFTNNVLTFLQDNELADHNNLRRTGRLIHRQTLRLDGDTTVDLRRWHDFAVDLSNIMRRERGAVYSVSLTFRKEYTLYDGAARPAVTPAAGVTAADRDCWDQPEEWFDTYHTASFDWEKYEWNEIDNPRNATYYMTLRHMDRCNLALSNLGVIAKRDASGRLHLTVADMLTAQPAGGVELRAYNFQQRVVGRAVTNASGMAEMAVEGTPFAVTATDGVSTTYLTLNSHNELSTNYFDVAGVKPSPAGLRCFFYGERGVWRPGDDMHLTLMVEDRHRSLPANHPVTLELFTPQQQLYSRTTLSASTLGIYSFSVATDPGAPTGSWKARFKVGNAQFDHTVRIETIAPNRLKVNIAAPDVLECLRSSRVAVDARWLAGNVAHGCAARLKMTLYPNPSPFDGYKRYAFSNPLCDFDSSDSNILAGQLDGDGHLEGSICVPAGGDMPGMMLANMVATVDEPGGGQSIAARQAAYSPYERYVGIALGEKEFETDRNLRFPVVCVDAHGQLVDGVELSYSVYRLDWNWWVECSASQLQRYVKGASTELVASGRLTASGGRAELPLRIDYPSWGRYLIYVSDGDGGHAAGGVATVDWPSWRGRANRGGADDAALLPFSLDKATYAVGDWATVFLPKADGGRVLLSVETGSQVVAQQWVSLSATAETAHRLRVTAAMAPNFYLHATLLQPYRKLSNGLGLRLNDLPIRLYGVCGATVVDSSTRLRPLLSVASEVMPQREFAVAVGEEKGRAMAYTLAIVDEGLLDITSFRTPQPWEAMNKREALGVATWDIFDDVVGAEAWHGGTLLTVGGDEALRRSAGAEKRFNPVVKFLGPFTLGAGLSRTHRITLPMYVGSVRVMVVASNGQGAYGSADRTVAVRAPLMLLPTLPRQLNCGDATDLTVNLFRSEKQIANATVTATVSGPASIVGGGSKTVAFGNADELATTLRLVADTLRSGTARVVVEARGGAFTATDTINIPVVNPQPRQLTSQARLLRPGERMTVATDWTGGRRATAGVLPTPTFDSKGAFGVLSAYPHACSEQLSAKALFCLYCRRNLDGDERRRAEQAIPGLLRAISSRQLADGSFAYWPGGEKGHEWVTSMAGEALVEARRQGYAVLSPTFDAWLACQRKAARSYCHSGDSDDAALAQAYRLYTLALAGEPERAALNKLRETPGLPRPVVQLLAAAYAQSGRRDVASRLLDAADGAAPGQWGGATFSSPRRNEAIALLANAVAQRRTQAFALAGKLAQGFRPSAATTQELAFMAAAMGRWTEVAGSGGSEVAITMTTSGKKMVVKDFADYLPLAVDRGEPSALVENRGRGAVTVVTTAERQPSATERMAARARGVELRVAYADLAGNPLDVASLRQGAEFVANIAATATAASSQSMAVTLRVPSGWELCNSRLAPDGEGEQCGEASYVDLRDGAVRFYFAAQQGRPVRFQVKLRAAYRGDYVLPAATCEDMYDNAVGAHTATGKRVRVAE